MEIGVAQSSAAAGTEIETEAMLASIKQIVGFGIRRPGYPSGFQVEDWLEAKFQELAQGAKAGCPVSKALGGVPEITLKATLRR